MRNTIFANIYNLNIMLKDILAISGKSGLYKFVSQGRQGIIVESLENKTRTHTSAAAKISALEDIAIFTDDEDVPLRDVFKAIHEKESGGKAISHKSSANELKEYMEEVLPEYDKDRVYVSDIKKLIQWYNILHDYDMLNFDEEEEEEEEQEETKTSEGKGEEKE